MFKLKDELVKTTLSNVRGGIGDIIREDFITAEDKFGKTRLCATFTFPQGSSIGNHANGPDAIEVYYVLSGSLQVTENGVTKELNSGDAMYTDGKDHSFVNTSNKDAVLLAVIMG